jgi:hypothetical protein
MGSIELNVNADPFIPMVERKVRAIDTNQEGYGEN